jgi:NAD(P)-dependent dehydrogenase (short-subunit alcohol dehydrogenase family)
MRDVTDVVSSQQADLPAEPQNGHLAALFDLRGKTAVVTGASSGLGLRFARVLTAAGASVVLCARRIERLNEISAALPRSSAVACDVSNGEQIDLLAELVQQRYGALDVIVNNAGTHHVSAAEHEPVDEFRRVLDVNVTGVFAVTQKLGGIMLRQGSGSIINIASILGLGASAPVNQASYCASKAAVINLSRELACQWAMRGVRVNCIAPGWFQSELTRDFLSDEKGTRWVERNSPMRRIGREHELDGALLYLASDASSFVTGHVLTVDGGWTSR